MPEMVKARPTWQTQTQKNEWAKEDFKWLSRMGRGSTYNNFAHFSHLPACSFDWGDGGYAGCSNNGGELLSLSQPSHESGVIIARGVLSTSLYASLYRTQVEFGGSSTFGLEVAAGKKKFKPGDGSNSSSFKLGSMIEKGSFNYRWPVNEYYLDDISDERGTDTDSSQSHATGELHVGTCQMFSCVMNPSASAANKDDDAGRIFYQVLRIEEHRPFQCFPDDAQVALTFGGPVWFKKEDFSGKKSDAEHKEQDTITNCLEDTTIRYYDKKCKVGLDAQIYQWRLADGATTATWHPLQPTQSTSEVDNGPDDGPTQNTTKAYNVYGPIVNMKAGSPNRSTFFLAVIRLFEGAPTEFSPKLPTSSDFYSYVGVDSFSGEATGAMWESLFLDRQGHPEDSQFNLELGEISLIGRSLEKILQVDLIPASLNPASVWNEMGKDIQPVALVSNLFTRPRIDLDSLFWKTRFLVQAYVALACHLDYQKFPGGEEPETHSPNEGPGDVVSYRHTDQDGYPCQVVERQKDRIRGHLQGILQYLFVALLSPNDQGDENPALMPEHNIPGDLGYYYVMPTIWYVLRNIPESKLWHIWPSKEDLVIIDDTKLMDGSRLPKEDWTFEAPEATRAALLTWFHYGSILKLWDTGFHLNEYTSSILGLKVRQLEMTAKTALAAKLSSRLPYVAEDEIVDRLSFLSAELRLETVRTCQVGTITSLTIKRIRQRDGTHTLKPGWFPEDHLVATSGPWEIHTLCHHSHLLSMCLERILDTDGACNWPGERTSSSPRSSIQRISSFLNVEGTLTACWERDHESENGGWLQSETSAVVATTLLMFGFTDMSSLQGVTRRATLPWGSPKCPLEKSAKTGSSADQSSPNQDARGPTIRHIEDQRNVIELFVNQQQRLPPIDWMVFKPPRLYYPESFTLSLENNPENYWLAELNRKHRDLPSSLKDFVRTPERHLRWKDLKTKEVGDYFRTWDIKSIGHSRAVMDDNAAWKILPSAKETQEDSSKSEHGLWLVLYKSLVDQELQHRFLLVKNPRIATSNKEKVKPGGENVLNLLLYVLHPESAPCLGNHMLAFSDFLCERLDEWTASITLTYWKVCYKAESAEGSGVSEDHDPPKPSSSSDFDQSKSGTVSRITTKVIEDSETKMKLDDSSPKTAGQHHHPEVNGDAVINVPEHAPPNLRKQWSGKNLAEIDVSSMVISTNAFGDFSKLTVISDLLGRQKGMVTTAYDRHSNVDRDSMHYLVKRARDIWQKFIHQPQTARCLVFLLVLGGICEQIRLHYRMVLDEIKSIRELWEQELMSNGSWLNPLSQAQSDTRSLYGGPEVHKMNLWTFESLNGVQSTLKDSINTVSEAKEALKAQIEDGPGKRDWNLEKICQKQLEIFDSNLVRLEAMSATLGQRVAATARSIETGQRILELEYSEAAKRQNASLQRLTYLTIGYLPVTLMAAMFAIPPERQVLGSSMDLKWFLLAVLILATITYLMAAYLGTLVGIWNVIIGWLRSKSAWRDWLKRRNGYKNDAVKEEDHRSEASEPRICLSV